jgi:hypothetical protein
MPAVPVVFVYTVVQRLLGQWSVDAGLDCSKSVRTLDTFGPRDALVLLDEVLNCFIENWNALRHTWEEHTRYVARKNCTVYQVVSELRYREDVEDPVQQGNGDAKDVTLSKAITIPIFLQVISD